MAHRVMCLTAANITPFDGLLCEFTCLLSRFANVKARVTRRTQTGTPLFPSLASSLNRVPTPLPRVLPSTRHLPYAFPPATFAAAAHHRLLERLKKKKKKKMHSLHLTHCNLADILRLPSAAAPPTPPHTLPSSPTYPMQSTFSTLLFTPFHHAPCPHTMHGRGGSEGGRTACLGLLNEHGTVTTRHRRRDNSAPPSPLFASLQNIGFATRERRFNY